jgi:hypothetical protein
MDEPGTSEKQVWSVVLCARLGQVKASNSSDQSLEGGLESCKLAGAACMAVDRALEQCSTKTVDMPGSLVARRA